MKVRTINPSTEEVISEYDIASKDEVNGKVRKSKSAFLDWKKDIKNRVESIHFLAEILRKNKQGLALMATNEMGKPIKESLAEVEKCALAMEFYGDNGSIFLTDEIYMEIGRASCRERV